MLNIQYTMLPNNFVGEYWRLASNWFQHVNIENYRNRPIRYLEIGTLYGANFISVAKTYGAHADSVMHCIDPWEDYTDYPEYKNRQATIYDTFKQNIEICGEKDKMCIHRGYSHKVVQELEDEYFDIIYIDGNHEPEYVMEDAVLCFRKLKKGGILIFDDYGWGGPDLTKRGIDGFLHAFYKKINVLGSKETQVFVHKL